MTFFNTVANLGNKWPTVVSMMLLDYSFPFGDSYIILGIGFALFGLLWLKTAGSRMIESLRNTALDEWTICDSSSGVDMVVRKPTGGDYGKVVNELHDELVRARKPLTLSPSPGTRSPLKVFGSTGSI